MKKSSTISGKAVLTLATLLIISVVVGGLLIRWYAASWDVLASYGSCGNGTLDAGEDCEPGVRLCSSGFYCDWTHDCMCKPTAPRSSSSSFSKSSPTCTPGCSPCSPGFCGIPVVCSPPLCFLGHSNDGDICGPCPGSSSSLAPPFVSLSATIETDKNSMIQYIFDPPLSKNFNLPYWGTTMKFPIQLWNRGTAPMSYAEWNSYTVSLKPQLPEGMPPSLITFDHIEQGRGCRMVNGKQNCDATAQRSAAGCTVQGLDVTCNGPLLTAGEIQYIDVFYKTVQPDPCWLVAGDDGYGYRTNLELNGTNITYVNVPLRCNGGCGDGNVNDAIDEKCDDGNKVNGDGCSKTCKIESGWKCGEKHPQYITGTEIDPYASVCWTCGDGKIGGEQRCKSVLTKKGRCKTVQECYNWPNGDGTYGKRCSWVQRGCPEYKQVCTWNGEDCDDGNKRNGDGCSTVCRVEDGFTCSGTCAPVCGDGKKLGMEVCDLGANNGKDKGCLTTCKVQNGWKCPKGNTCKKS